MEKLVAIPALKRETAIIKIRGISDLIMHKHSEQSKKKIEDKQQGKATKGHGIRDPQAEYEAAMHKIDDNGRVGFPAGGFKKAMIRAGKLIGVNMTDARQMFHIIADNSQNLIEIKADPPKRGEDWVRLNSRVGDIRYRPYFSNWSAEIPIEYDPDLISLEQLVNLLNHAGWKVGIGDHRPEKDGNNGMWEVVTD